jgi:hypothetical protein
LPSPHTPSTQEVDEHNRNHYPYRSWCHHCVRGKKDQLPHLTGVPEPETALPQVEDDYGDVGFDDDSETVTFLCLAEKKHTLYGCLFVRQKGSDDLYVLEAAARWVDRTAWKELILKGDSEPALEDLNQAICAKRTHPTHFRATPKESKGSLGRAEGGNKLMAGQMRTLISATEERFGVKIRASHVLMPWLVRHCPWQYNRFQRHKDGKTSYRRLYGKDYAHSTLEFGEVAEFRLTGRQQSKLELRWCPGVYVGKDEETDDFLYLTKHGLQSSRSAQRKPMGQRWDAGFLSQVVGSPWNPRAVVGHKVAAGAPLRGSRLRQMYITKSMVSEKGGSKGCPGCEGKGLHNPTCRRRFESLYPERKVQAESEVIPNLEPMDMDPGKGDGVWKPLDGVGTSNPPPAAGGVPDPAPTSSAASSSTDNPNAGAAGSTRT